MNKTIRGAAASLALLAAMRAQASDVAALRRAVSAAGQGSEAGWNQLYDGGGAVAVPSEPVSESGGGGTASLPGRRGGTRPAVLDAGLVPPPAAANDEDEKWRKAEECRHWPGECWAEWTLIPVGKAWDLRAEIGTVPAGILTGLAFAALAAPAIAADVLGGAVGFARGAVNAFSGGGGLGPYRSEMNAP